MFLCMYMTVLRYRLRLGFLDHLEQWKLETSAKAHESVSGKVCTCDHTMYNVMSIHVYIASYLIYRYTRLTLCLIITYIELIYTCIIL